MGDLFKRSDLKNLTTSERLYIKTYGASDQTWEARAKEAREFMEQYISDHPEAIVDAVAPVEEVRYFIKTMMDEARKDYLDDKEHEGTEPQKDFAYARYILLFEALRTFLKDMKDDGEKVSFIGLCDGAEEAIHKRIEKLTEKCRKGKNNE